MCGNDTRLARIIALQPTVASCPRIDGMVETCKQYCINGHIMRERSTQHDQWLFLPARHAHVDHMHIRLHVSGQLDVHS